MPTDDIGSKTTSRPAMGIAADEFQAAVHGAEESRIRLPVLAPPSRFLLVVMPAERSRSIAICLPGMASKVEAGRDFGDGPKPLVIHHEIHDHQDRDTRCR